MTNSSGNDSTFSITTGTQTGTTTGKPKWVTCAEQAEIALLRDDVVAARAWMDLAAIYKG